MYQRYGTVGTVPVNMLFMYLCIQDLPVFWPGAQEEYDQDSFKVRFIEEGTHQVPVLTVPGTLQHFDTDPDPVSPKRNATARIHFKILDLDFYEIVKIEYK